MFAGLDLGSTAPPAPPSYAPAQVSQPAISASFGGGGGGDMFSGLTMTGGSGPSPFQPAPSADSLQHSGSVAADMSSELAGGVR